MDPSRRRPWETSYAQRPLLFHNDHGKLRLVTPVAGSALAEATTGRGLAWGDLWNDGRLEAVINNVDGSPSLLVNVVSSGNHWVELHLVGGPRSPRDAIGARVTLAAGGMQQRADLVSGGSYASSSDPRIHFGLGAAAAI